MLKGGGEQPQVGVSGMGVSGEKSSVTVGTWKAT